MKDILIPTDFSDCASYATNVAFSIAETIGATVHLYSKINIHFNWINLTEAEKQEYPEDIQKIKNTEILLKEWKHKADERGITMKTAWSGGNLIENIKDYSKVYKIDFIVMGSHGVSGRNEFFIGSNTQKVVRVVHCPILVIKNDLDKFHPKKVVFASDFDEKEKMAFQYLLDFVKPFNPEIHLVAINTSSWFGQPYILVKSLMDDFQKMCGDLKSFTHFYRDWNVDSGIRHLSGEIGADLISISNQQRHPLRRMIRGSNVEALVNHADAPVLSIDFPKVSNS